MKLDKPANKVVITSVLTASALGMAVPSTLMETANAESKIMANTVANENALETLNKLYKHAHLGEMHNFEHELTLNKSTREDVRIELGSPDEEADTTNDFDKYHGSMGQASYAFSYHKNGTISEIRYFGTNIEREQNLGGINAEVLNEQLGSPDKILTVPNTNEINYVYKTGDYELHFIIDDSQTVNHVNLTE